MTKWLKNYHITTILLWWFSGLLEAIEEKKYEENEGDYQIKGWFRP